MIAKSSSVREFLDAVTEILVLPDAGDLNIYKFLELGSSSVVVFLRSGFLKVKAICQRDYVEFRLGPFAAPDEFADKVDGVRYWFFPETIRDFLDDCAPVDETEIFNRDTPNGVEESVAAFANLLFPRLSEFLVLFEPENFQSCREALAVYEKQRADQISEMSGRRYPTMK